MPIHWIRLVACAAMVALCGTLSGCGATISDRTWRQASYSLGAARKLVVVQVTGKRSLREQILSHFQRQARATGWWQVDSRIGSGLSINLDGADPKALPKPPEGTEVFVRIDAYESIALREFDQEGTPVVRGKVSFGITTVDPSGRAVLAEKDYTGTVVLGEGEGVRDLAIEESIASAVEQFLADVTPRAVTVKISIDDEEEDMDPIVELVRDRAYGLALVKLEAMHKAQPDRADVIYNIAVVLHGQRKYERAIKHYDDAIRISPRKLYHDARAACAQRIETLRQTGR